MVAEVAAETDLVGTDLVGTVFSVRTFSSGHQGGNLHDVYLCQPGLLKDAGPIKWFLRHTKRVSVFLFLEPGFQNFCRDCSSQQVRFYQHGVEILRCGSGVLAAAKVLIYLAAQKGRAQQPETSFQLSTRVECLTVLARGDLLGYRARALSQQPLKSVAVWQYLLRARVCDGAFVGGQRDYLIAELLTPEAVQRVVPHLEALCLFTQRALIVTARGTLGKPQTDSFLKSGAKLGAYVMRYFAPQYGNNEDQATGSANVQLMRYWHRRHLGAELACKQLSREGGEFIGYIVGASGVELFGQAYIEAPP